MHSQRTRGKANHRAVGLGLLFVVLASGGAGAVSKVPGITAAPSPASLQIGVRKVSSLASGEDHSLIVLKNGRVMAFGSNYYGQLGVKTDDDFANMVPREVEGINAAISVAVGNGFSVVLQKDGTVWTFGASGALGRSYEILGNRKAGKVPGLGSVESVAASGQHTFAVKKDGTVWGFGMNEGGIFGPDDSRTNYAIPTQIAGLSNIVTVSTSPTHTLALKADGTVWSFGENQSSELGRATQGGFFNPAVQVPNLSNAVAIAAASRQSAVLRSDGSVWTFGSNATGGLGRLTPVDAVWGLKSDPKPGLVPNFPKVASIQSDGTISATKSDGSVWVFADPQYGEVVAGSLVNRKIVAKPKRLEGVNQASIVASGSSTVLFVGTDGIVRSLGQNGSGELGRATKRVDGSMVADLIPGPVSGI
jgi:alpha-tubulin suppressor-like RCC1 family protein